MGPARRRCAALLLAAAVGGAATAAPPDTLEQRLQACTLCHGAQGREGSDAYYPRIAGKPERYLYQQLLNFREGRRHYAPMTGLLDHLQDSYLREIAAHFAQQAPPLSAPAAARVPADQLDHGRRLATLGDPARDLPACAACHGDRLNGRGQDIPGLLGLPRDYINAQLGAWRDGLRRAADPDCMATVARRLTPQDVSAVSAWLSSRPASQTVTTRPGLTSEPPLPMRCAPATPPMARVMPRATATAASTSSAAASHDASPQITRGRQLALAGNCAGCHTARGGAEYAGGRSIETPFGTVFAGNLTPDEVTGLGRWSADDFWKAMHEGRSRDGRLLYPAFPYPNFTRITREDSDAIFAWLKTLPAVRQPNRPHALRFPYDLQIVLAGWRALFFRPGTFRPDPGRDAEWNRGAYLVQGLGHCDACHAQRNLLGATREAGGLGGGRIGSQGWDAPSLAPGVATSVPRWRVEDHVALLATGLSRQGSATGPMAEVVARSTRHLPPEDLRAIAVYLTRLPVETSSAARPAAPPDAQDPREGRPIYERHCADCHGARGEGVPGVYPPLAGNQTLNLSAPDNAIRAVLSGGFTVGGGDRARPYGMPPFAPFLSDREIAAVLGYVRQSWGNDAGRVGARAVSAQRGLAAH